MLPSLPFALEREQKQRKEEEEDEDVSHLVERQEWIVMNAAFADRHCVPGHSCEWLPHEGMHAVPLTRAQTANLLCPLDGSHAGAQPLLP